MMELGYFDPATGQEFVGPAAPPTLPKDYTLANTIITGLGDITKSILGLVAVSKAASATKQVPGAMVPYTAPPAPGISTPALLAIGIPVALVGAIVLSKR